MERSGERETAGPTTFNILFVCTGNTCRSPMAEALARREIERRGWQHVRVASAGIAASPGAPASDQAIRSLRSIGLDLRGHSACAVDVDLVGWADLVLAMGPSHLAAIDQLGGSDKTALLGDFATGYEGGGSPVPDPFGAGAEAYSATRIELERLIQQAFERLTPIVDP